MTRFSYSERDYAFELRWEVRRYLMRSDLPRRSQLYLCLLDE